MAREVFRIEPQAGPEAFKTYQIVAPVQTHYRPASCREVECEGWRNGFVSAIDVSTELGVRQAAYITKDTTRRHTKAQAGTIVSFTFRPGTTCFRAPHQVPLERDPIYLVRDGDHRGNPYGTQPQRRNADEWVDDFGEHQQRLADRIEKG